MGNYKSVHKIGRDEIIINKSKFIGTSVPVENEEEALSFIDSVRKEFKDASHNCYAYVIGENKNIQRYSDDKEPSGTAGMPILNVINQENLINTAVVVTRYFGGVMLGAGGLVRAYTKGAKISLESGIIVERNLYYDVSFNLDYTLLGKMDNDLQKNNIIIKDKIYLETVKYSLLIKDDGIENIRTLLNEITNGKIDINIGHPAYYSVADGKIIWRDVKLNETQLNK
ncbi:YigZ family protein [Sedimentibacter hydroxybenzoicus DSM 7310]|uniref:YigZ family protein n=1 Tax=Sedimentibacter hydroxybenzoicus DSM 7310 TaxID=1123245 RepID=A0A974GXW0_SEDHY|nr:YigZ family protein [Sedimentibacter hydroxybenzoicus]NYB76027.1 YigZ family protein [Sedimentibacter hydroxybenzoicus DSM 7310]